MKKYLKDIYDRLLIWGYRPDYIRVVTLKNREFYIIHVNQLNLFRKQHSNILSVVPLKVWVYSISVRPDLIKNKE